MPSHRSRSLRVLPVLAGLIWCLQASGQTPPAATLAVDATDAPRQMLHAHLTLPVPAGPLTLYFPKWIPGEHSPTGPIGGLAGLQFHAGGAAIAWQRDPADMFAFHLTVPPGADSLAVDLDFLTPLGQSNFTSGPSATPTLSILSWNTVVLFPQGRSADDLPVDASLKLPAGWKYATALPVAGEAGDTVRFQTAPLSTLIDSPVVLGAHLKKVPVAQTPPHEIDIVADSEEALAAPADFAGLYANLVAETGALFGSRHYRDYHWLLTLSEKVEHFGLEHHESSDDRTDEPTLGTEGRRRGLAGLLAHEFVHSWNGKYRRPTGLLDPDYHQPMRGNLLWVYEGLTEYLGYLLPARSGLWTPAHYREEVALIAATLDHEPGRTWRPLEDTAIAAQMGFGGGHEYAAWRRGADYYQESLLIWLEADMLIRQATGGKRSLDDFCHAFYGGPGGAPALKPYTFDDVVAAMNAVAPHDWAAFFTERLTSLAPHAPLGGLALAGWKLAYGDRPNEASEDAEARSKWTDWTFSLGITVKDDGTIRDVIRGGPADSAGLAPGDKLTAIDGRAWTKERLEAAMLTAKGAAARKIEVLAMRNDFYRTFAIDYHDGPRHPHLERDASRPDLLAVLLKPLARH